MDRIVGPTHHFGGLGVGNLASHLHRGQVANPCAAALQGLDKMRLVAELGCRQLILPPQRRPRFDLLNSLGFVGDDREVLKKAREEDPLLLSAAMSCSAMWMANAATVVPGADSGSGTTSLVVANLDASVHRSIEPEETRRELEQTLPGSITVIGPLPGGSALRDEGAANHMRLSRPDDDSPSHSGIHVFVYGDCEPLPAKHWPRHTEAACLATARLCGLHPRQTCILKQHPDAIDAGAFHNDVVAMSHQDLMIHHDQAFLDDRDQLGQLDASFAELTGHPLIRIAVDRQSLSLQDAIATYLFNSQIVTAGEPGQRQRVILCPSQVDEHPAAKRLVDGWVDQRLFDRVHYVDLAQSMDGGGGPACLRLRLPLSPEEISALPRHRTWSPELDDKLRREITSRYPTSVTIDELARHDFVEHAIEARNRLAAVLQTD